MSNKNAVDVTTIRNGKVRCVGYKTAERYFTKGKVYAVTNDQITADNGYTYTHGNVMKYLSYWYEFEPAEGTDKFKVGDKVIGNNPDRYGITKKGWIGTVTAVRQAAICVSGKGLSDSPCSFWVDPQYFDLYTEEKIIITRDGKTTTATKYCSDGSKVTATARCAPEDDFDFRIGAEIAMGRLVDKLVFANFEVIRVVFREGERPYSYKTRMKTAKVGMTIAVPVGAYGKKVNATVVEIISGANYDGEYAMSAMKEIDIVEAPKYYNGSVVCVERGYWGSVPVSKFTVGKVYTVVDGKIISDTGRRSNSYRTVELLCGGMGWKFIPIVE